MRGPMPKQISYLPEAAAIQLLVNCFPVGRVNVGMETLLVIYEKKEEECITLSRLVLLQGRSIRTLREVTLQADSGKLCHYNHYYCKRARL